MHLGVVNGGDSGCKALLAVAIKRMLLGFAVVFLAGVLFDILTRSPDYRNPFMAGVFAVALTAVAGLLVAVLNAISGGLYLWLFADKDISSSILAELRAAKLPGPRATDSKDFVYLAQLANDDDAPIEARVKAASLYASYDTAMRQGLFHALMLRRALDDAMLRYSFEAPQR